MSKRVLNILTVFLVIVLLLSAGQVILSFISLSQNVESGSLLDTDTEANYHFMVILDGGNTDYINEVREGATAASLDYEVTFEFWEFSSQDKIDEIVKQFDIGVYSEVDGIIVNTYKDIVAYEEVLRRANAANIPVITLNEDIGSIEKISHIDMNQYTIGNRVASVLKQADLSPGVIIVLQGQDENYEDTATGLFDSMGHSYTIVMENIENTGENVMNAEGLTREIISKYSDISAIISFDSDVTIGVVQGVKDANKVGDIQVVGFGFTDEIREYIEKEVIYATVVADYYHLGYNSIESLVKYVEGEFVSSYQTIGIDVPSKSNLQQYMEEVGLIDEATREED